MNISTLPKLLAASVLCVLGCNSPTVPDAPGIPQPIRVLANPTTGERVRFFREHPLKVPAGYDEEKHLLEWTAEQQKRGFTKDILLEDDREQWAELRQRNLAAARQGKPGN